MGRRERQVVIVVTHLKKKRVFFFDIFHCFFPFSLFPLSFSSFFFFLKSKKDAQVFKESENERKRE